jgi:hypothetical protein
MRESFQDEDSEVFVPAMWSLVNVTYNNTQKVDGTHLWR